MIFVIYCIFVWIIMPHSGWIRMLNKYKQAAKTAKKSFIIKAKRGRNVVNWGEAYVLNNEIFANAFILIVGSKPLCSAYTHQTHTRKRRWKIRPSEFSDGLEFEVCCYWFLRLANAALIKAVNNGWPLRGLEVNSGWNWQAKNQGWFGSSMVSTKRSRPADTPPMTKPAFSSAGT